MPSHKPQQFCLRRLPLLLLIPGILKLVPKFGAKFWYQFYGTRIWCRFLVRMSWALRSAIRSRWIITAWDYLFFHFVNDLRLGRRVVEKAGKHLQSTAVAGFGGRSRGHVTTDVLEEHLTLRQRQGASHTIVGVEELRQNTMTSIIQRAVLGSSFVGCPSTKRTGKTSSRHIFVY